MAKKGKRPSLEERLDRISDLRAEPDRELVRRELRRALAKALGAHFRLLLASDGLGALRLADQANAVIRDLQLAERSFPLALWGGVAALAASPEVPGPGEVLAFVVKEAAAGELRVSASALRARLRSSGQSGTGGV